jgi:hypothetical protein
MILSHSGVDGNQTRALIEIDFDRHLVASMATFPHALVLDVSDLYRSLPLQPNSTDIRLLKIHPRESTADADAPVNGKLFVASLEARPSFTALSYVWGTDYGSHMVRCSTYDIPITENCNTALQNLRNKLGTVVIWVDAICINQKDTAERSQQVQLMDRIYTYAETSYMWLGSTNARAERAISYLSRAGSFSIGDEENASKPGQGSGKKVQHSPWAIIRQQWSATSYPFPSQGESSKLH